MRTQRHKRIRARVKGTKERPRLAVFRSNKHLYASLINDETHEVLFSASDLALPPKTKDIAQEVGKLIAQKAMGKNIKKVVFDRAGYKYHGKVKALAESAREQGLVF
ncbi:MAG: 50S ribosomal protein L18 [Candidatus Wildermuthbacteria bacterium]|nr:50S ribosomal protein L18 [Candidatus Wildermuthbacteria bacterium]